MIAMTYGNVYVARVAMGVERHADRQGVPRSRSLRRAVLIIAYSHCIAHGYDLTHGLEQQKAAVESGYWPLFRYNPALASQGKNPFQLDRQGAQLPLKDYIYNETRYTMLAQSDPDDAKRTARAGPGGRDAPLEAVRALGAHAGAARRRQRRQVMIDLTKTIDLSTNYWA